MQKTGGTFTLTAETDFGATYGLKTAYIKSQGTNPASAGVVRLANTELIKWRNAANSADLGLTVNASDALQFNGVSFLYPGLASIVNADISASAAIAYSKLNLATSILNADISASAAIALSKLAAVTASRALVSDGSGVVSVATTTATEIGYVNGVTSAIQTQINDKAPAASPTFSGTITTPLTASRALATGASSELAASATTATELGYVSGVTSAIQTQLDAKVPKTLTTTTGDMIYASSANTPARLPIGSSGQVIKSVGGVPTWATFSGGINYLSSNPDAESDTTGWATYADAAGTSPVNGVDGSPTSTWTRTTSSALRGSGSFLYTRDAANRQGEGVSYDFTIDTADKAKVLQVEFDYMLASGAFTAGTTSTDSELTVWLYDVTNSVLIQPSTYKLYTSSSTIPDKFIGNFQTASDSTSYRLIIHCGSTTATAFTMQFDNFKVGPCSYVYGTPITDWQSYTPSNTDGFGTISSVNLRWRQAGSDMQIQGGFTSGTMTASTARIELPNSRVIGGTASARIHAGNLTRPGTAGPYTVLGVQGRSYLTFGSGGSSHGDIGGTSLLGNGEAVLLTVTTLPITGWSSSSQQSDGYDGRLIAAKATTCATAVANTASGTLVFSTKITDKTNSYDTSTGLFTAPSSGTYRVTVHISTNAVAHSANGYAYLYPYKTGVSQQPIVIKNWETTASVYAAFGGSAQIDLNAGDTLGVRLTNQSGATLTCNGTDENTISFEKLSAPTTISATETVAFSAEGATSSSVGSNTDIGFTTITEDTHGGWNSTNKDWTAPHAGTYEVTFASRVTGAPSANQYVDFIIQIDGTTKREFAKYVENAATSGWSGVVHWQGKLTAGQKINATVDTNITTPSLTTGATHTYMHIKKIK